MEQAHAYQRPLTTVVAVMGVLLDESVMLNGP